MSNKIALGMVGTGRIGRVHGRTLRQLVPQADLQMVTDVNLQSAQECADLYGIPKVVQSFDDILADKSIDAVVICSSTDTHIPFIIKAAQAGKHIFCEKPISTDLAKIDEANAAVEKAGVKLMIGFNRRFDPTFQRVKQAIEKGEVGKPHLMHIISRDPAPPPIAYIKVSGGLFFDMTIHDFDMARFLLGDVETVYATAGVMVDPAIGAAGDIDTASITLNFANGAIGTIENSRKAVYGYDQRVEVFGSGGAARSENIFPNAVTISNGTNIANDLPLNFFMDRYIAAYQNELIAFVDCVVNNTPSPVTGKDGRAPVVIALAGMKSLREKRPVAISEIG